MSTELTVIDRARALLKFDATKAKLTELAEGTARIVEITNKAGYDECHRARMVLRDTRNEITEAGKAAREDANKLAKAVIAAENELVGMIEPEEKRLRSLQEAVDDAKKLEKEAKERAERERIAALNARFDAIKTMPAKAIGKTQDQIKELIAEASEIDPQSFPDDVRAAAVFELRNAVAGLKAALDARWLQDEKEAQAEKDRAELAAAREALAKIEREKEAQAKAEQAKQEAAQREADRKAAEARAEADRVAKAEQEAQRMAMQEIQGIQHQAVIARLGRAGVRKGGTIECLRETLAETERWPIDADRFGALTETAERAKTSVVETIKAMLHQAEQDVLQAAESDRQATEAKRLADERKELELRRIEAEINSASTVEAMTAAHALLVKEGYGARKETKMLAAAIKRESSARKAA